jgi:hypothetical protein
MSNEDAGSNKLNKLFSQYREADEIVRQNTEESAKSKSTFGNDVAIALKNALRPAFQEIEAGYKANKADVSVGECQPITYNGPKSRAASVAGQATSLISMRFSLVRGWRLSASFPLMYYPDVGFVVDESTSSIALYVTELRVESGPPRVTKTFAPSGLTKAVAMDAIVDVIAEANAIGAPKGVVR